MGYRQVIKRWAVRILAGIALASISATLLLVLADKSQQPFSRPGFDVQQWWGFQSPWMVSIRRRVGIDRYEWRGNDPTSHSLFGRARRPNPEVLRSELKLMSLGRQSPEFRELPNWLLLKNLVVDGGMSDSAHAVSIRDALQQGKSIDGVELSVGWPFRVAFGSYFVVQKGAGSLDQAVYMLSVPVGGDRFVPLGIDWLGLVGNAAFFAGLVAAGQAIAVRISAIWRRAHGCCDRCGYELRELKSCPECGAASRLARDSFVPGQ